MEAIYIDDDILEFEENQIAQVKKLFDLMQQALDDVATVSQYACKQDDKSIRKLKITEISYATERFNSKFIPFIRLTGRWLDKAGFKAGEYAQVIAIKGMVLIVPVRVPEVDGEGYVFR